MSRQGLLNDPIVSKKRRCGEMMGGATAECTAVVCCCPFAVMDMLVLALYKAPKGMCRKAIEKKRRNRKNKKNGLLMPGEESDGGVVLEDGGLGNVMLDGELVRVRDLKEIDDVDFDSEMCEKFYGTGFWRSDSQRSSELLQGKGSPRSSLTSRPTTTTTGGY